MNFYVLCAFVFVTCFSVYSQAAEGDQVVLGCLGKMPVPFSKAMKKVNLHVDLPKAPKEKRDTSGKTTTTPKPAPKANLPAPTQTKVKKFLKEMGWYDDGHLSCTNMRRSFDDNYATGQKQVVFWRDLKTCCRNSADYRRTEDVETDLFIDCAVAAYKKQCPN